MRAAALQPNAVFETMVRLVDEGRHLEGEGTWSVTPGVVPLEQWITGTAASVAMPGVAAPGIAELGARAGRSA